VTCRCTRNFLETGSWTCKGTSCRDQFMTPLVPCSLTRVAHSRTRLKRQVLGSTTGSEFARLRGNFKLKLVTSWYLADLVAWICLVSCATVNWTLVETTQASSVPKPCLHLLSWWTASLRLGWRASNLTLLLPSILYNHYRTMYQHCCFILKLQT
jgi:hypothetical protein